MSKVIQGSHEARRPKAGLIACHLQQRLETPLTRIRDLYIDLLMNALQIGGLQRRGEGPPSLRQGDNPYTIEA